MVPDSSFYLSSLKNATLRMLRHLRNETFMGWVSQHLAASVGSSHVSIALFDRERGSFPIETSVGRHRLPPHFVTIDPSSSIIQWFCSPRSLLDLRQIKKDQDPFSQALFEEMQRLRTEICAKIHTHEQLAGCLLIGPREEGTSYSLIDMDLFETLANDIAIEIEKEAYYNLALFDPLTGLLNRNSMEETFQSLIEEVQRTGHGFAVALLDLDDFKEVNDQYGHTRGDLVLRIGGELIRRGIRKTDYAFRYGGEEFLLLIRPNSRDPARPLSQGAKFQAEVYQVLERLRVKISERSIECSGPTIRTTVSMGLAFYEENRSREKGNLSLPMLARETLIHEADQALYASKLKGKNCISVYPSLYRLPDFLSEKSGSASCSESAPDG